MLMGLGNLLGIMSSSLQLGFLLCHLKCGLPGAFHLKWYLKELWSSRGRDLDIVLTSCKALSSLLEKTTSHFLCVHVVIPLSLAEIISNI